jgi:hypothetical protein
MSALIVRAGLDFERPQFTPESIGDRARRELPNRPLPELDEHDEGPEAPVRRMCSEALEAPMSSPSLQNGGARRSEPSRMPLRGFAALGPVGPFLDCPEAARGYATRRGWAACEAARSRIMWR